MGVIKQGILGGVSGKVGSVIGTSWKGIAVLKSRPLSVANPNTAAQQAQRGAMTQIVAATRALQAALIQPLWNPVAVRMSGYNYFVKTNIQYFSTSGLATPASLLATRGTLLGAAIATSVTDASDNTTVLTWDDNTGQADALGTDVAVGVSYNADKDLWKVSGSSATRADETLTIADTDTEAGDVVHTYLGFYRPNYSKIANSSYLVSTVQA